jgi:hypothetical protein
VPVTVNTYSIVGIVIVEPGWVDQPVSTDVSVTNAFVTSRSAALQWGTGWGCGAGCVGTDPCPGFNIFSSASSRISLASNSIQNS